MGLIATAVMIINVWAYTKNSVYEKSLLAVLDKTRMQLTLGNGEVSEDTGGTEENDESTDGEGEG